MNFRLLPAMAFFLAAFGTVAQAEPAAKMVNGILVNPSGMTLYVFDRDVAGSGKSACNGPCAALWPPAAAAADTMAEGDFTVITRDDGTRQWAWKGKPLYRYSADAKVGDKTGDNFRDVWHVAK